MLQLTKFLEEKPKKHLVFDFDGTIFKLDWTPRKELDDFRWRLWETFKTIDPEYMREMPEPIYGKSEEIVSDMILNHRDKAKEMLFPILEEREALLIDTAKPISRIVQFINEQNSNYTFHIWSSNMSTTFKQILESNDILQHFDKLIGREHVVVAKPHPGGFELIHDQETPKEDYLMLGDRSHDEDAAKGAGIDFFKVE